MLKVIHNLQQLPFQKSFLNKLNGNVINMQSQLHRA